jgi:glycosyltransferase involved in cell wall biosynthesis
MSLNIRMYTWLQGGLSWSYVMSRLAKAFNDSSHNVYFASTNGLANSDSFLNKDRMLMSTLELQKFGPGKKSIDIDLTYTVPQNFPKRFLANSKHKCAIYNYETTLWEPKWKQFYGLVDFYFPSSNFSSEVFYINGIDPKKIFTIPHGVDTSVFNPDIPPIKLNTKKKFKFVSVVAPHFRKNIDLLLESYCEAFTAKDDVCLVLKTKVFKHSDGAYHVEQNPKGRKGFEIIIGDIFKKLYKKHGKNMPEIELLSGHVENVSSIYNACDCHITTTGSEGFGMPIAESMACGLLNIAPRYSGHLDFIDDNSGLLIDTKMRIAGPFEQYWAYNPKSEIGHPKKRHTVELMHKAVNEYDELIEKFRPNMKSMIDEFSWTNATEKIIKAVSGEMPHYEPGTYNCWPRK